MNDTTFNITSHDSIVYRKHCKDFVSLNDGTLMGEYKYCNLSRQCRQIDMVDGSPVPMESHYCPVVDPRTGEVIEFEYYCTGMHDCRSRNERLEDDKIS